MQTPLRRIDYPAIRREHVAIDSVIQEERRWWNELREIGKPHLNEMGQRLRVLRGRISSHFCREEKTEALAGDVNHACLSSSDIECLCVEHAELLRDLDVIIARLDASDAQAYQTWGDAGAAFAAFVRRFEEQEAVELRALEDMAVPIES